MSPPSRIDLLGQPENGQPALAVDGERIAFARTTGGAPALWVARSDGSDARVVGPSTQRLQRPTWTGDGAFVAYQCDEAGDENFHVFAVPASGGEATDLTPYPHVRAELLGRSPRGADQVLVAMNKENPARFDLYSVQVPSGVAEVLVTGRGSLGFFVDNDVTRLALNGRADGSYAVEHADGTTLLEIPADDSIGIITAAHPGLTPDGSALHLLTSVGADTVRLAEVPVPDGRVTTVLADPRYDVTSAIRDATGRILAAGVQRTRLCWEAVDPTVQGDLDRLAEWAPEEWRFCGADGSGRRWLVQRVEDEAPATYACYDRLNGQVRELFVDRPALVGATLAAMEPFTVRTRDGVELDGYLSFPPGADRTPLPTVLLVHGGPWERDVWGYHPWAQFLATRGYLCVQVNFRGSTGYGRSFALAGDREWGARCHDDLVDTVRHLVVEGVADSSRLAIMGGSYGGYAALVGATFTPELFRCAVDVVGPSNLGTLVQAFPAYWGPIRHRFLAAVGDPEAEPDFLWSRSPLSRVDALRMPLLVAHGANDPRVRQSESEQLVEALRERGLPYEYVLAEDEGHGFTKPANVERLFERIEAFLATHLVPDAVRSSA